MNDLKGRAIQHQAMQDVRHHAASFLRISPFKLRPHHAKPMRKRHVLSFIFFALLLIVATATAVAILYDQLNQRLDANLAVREQADRYITDTSTRQSITSSFGYTFSYNSSAVSVTAGIATNDDIFSGDSLRLTRNYNKVVFTANNLLREDQRTSAASSMNVSILTGTTISNKSDDAQLRTISDTQIEATTKQYTIVKDKEVTEEISGISFLHTTYQKTLNYVQKGDLALRDLRIDLYVGVLNNNYPIVIRIIAPDTQSQQLYGTILGSLSIGQVTSAQSFTGSSLTTVQPDIFRVAQQFGFLPARASAASSATMDESRIVATNVPAVVKVYHVLCGAITYNNQTITDDSCNADSGTGFFVSSDGYIATNGHVVSSSPKQVITNNMTSELFQRMLEIDGYSSREIATIMSQVVASADFESIVANAVNQLPDSALGYASQKDFYIVALSSDMPELAQILENRTFADTTTIKTAKLVAIDYDPSDLTNDTGFTRSDVALLKLEGLNYPFVRLGSLNTIAQGMRVTVIGFPSDAETNNLIKTDTLQTTVTQGIVSAIREVNGGNLKVVQSDVAIGHGNSGGPAFDQTGKAFGIATYMIGGTAGDANISYLRDINDLRNLMRVHNVEVDETSTTQAAWESGLTDFYAAYYSSAIKKFEQAQTMYAPHSLAEQFIAIARVKIAAGEEARSAWMPVAIGIIIAGSIIGLIVSTVLIVRHRAHHHLYQAIEKGYIRSALTTMHLPHNDHEQHLPA